MDELFEELRVSRDRVVTEVNSLVKVMEKVQDTYPALIPDKLPDISVTAKLLITKDLLRFWSDSKSGLREKQ